MLTAGVVLLHDNAHPHTTQSTAAVLSKFCCELFDHPPYSPDLAPSDFSHFLALQEIPVFQCACDRRAEDVCHMLVPFIGCRVLRWWDTKVDPMI